MDEAKREEKVAGAPRVEDPGDKDPEEMERLQAEIRNLPVDEHVLYMMHSLSALAIGRLGLAGEAGGRRDLGEARLAIDAFRVLMDLVEPVRAAEEWAIHRETLSQLQMAYVTALNADEAVPEKESEPITGPASE